MKSCRISERDERAYIRNEIAVRCRSELPPLRHLKRPAAWALANVSLGVAGGGEQGGSGRGRVGGGR